MTAVRNSVRYLHGITNERNSEGRSFSCRDSVFGRNSVRVPILIVLNKSLNRPLIQAVNKALINLLTDL